MQPMQRLFVSLLTLVAILVLGTLGYHLIEHWPLFDSFYMTIITLSTVGYSEIRPLSTNGQIFTIILILFGAGLIAYTIGNLIQFAVEGQLRQFLGRKKLAKQIEALRTHYIICGYGRIGRQVVRELKDNDVPIVVIEDDERLCQEMRDKGIFCVNGDATADEILLTAGILTAKGLISVTTSDSTNLYITLSARGLSEELLIISRSANPSSESKLRRAGADQVISPYTMGAKRITQAVLCPSVLDKLETATTHENQELHIDEVVIGENSSLIGKELRHSGIRELGVIVVSLRRRSGLRIFPPPPEVELLEGDILVTAGELADTHRLDVIANGIDNA